MRFRVDTELDPASPPIEGAIQGTDHVKLAGDRIEQRPCWYVEVETVEQLLKVVDELGEVSIVAQTASWVAPQEIGTYAIMTPEALL